MLSLSPVVAIWKDWEIFIEIALLSKIARSTLHVWMNLKLCLHRRENITCCRSRQRWRFEKMGHFYRKCKIQIACVNQPLSGVYTGIKTINNCHWQLQFETDFSILKLHCWAKSPTQITCVNEPLRLFTRKTLDDAKVKLYLHYGDKGAFTLANFALDFAIS
jgi:hypothetical protein